MGESIQLSNVSFSYIEPEKLVLENITYQFKKNSTTVFLGANGIGKSTLLSLLIGFIQPQKGHLSLGSTPYVDIPQKEMGKQIAFLPQIENAPIFLTVEEFIVMGRTPYLSRFNSPGQKDYQVAESMVQKLHLGHIRDKKMNHISGGELQLAFLARALAQEPQVLIMDEPMNHLDLKNQAAMVALINQLKSNNITIILSTHIPQMAAAIADNIILFLPDGSLTSGEKDTMLTKENLSQVYQTSVDVVRQNGSLFFKW